MPQEQQSISAPQEQTQTQHTEQSVQAEQLAVQTEHFDAVLDDIASVLETNAQEYVSSFVQQGGE